MLARKRKERSAKAESPPRGVDLVAVHLAEVGPQVHLEMFLWPSPHRSLTSPALIAPYSFSTWLAASLNLIRRRTPGGGSASGDGWAAGFGSGNGSAAARPGDVIQGARAGLAPEFEIPVLGQGVVRAGGCSHACYIAVVPAPEIGRAMPAVAGATAVEMDLATEDRMLAVRRGGGLALIMLSLRTIEMPAPCRADVRGGGAA